MWTGSLTMLYENSSVSPYIVPGREPQHPDDMPGVLPRYLHDRRYLPLDEEPAHIIPLPVGPK